MIQKTQQFIYRLLRRSETYTKTDMVYLAKGGSWLFFAQAVTFVSGFLLLIVISHFFPREAYGTYRYVLAFVIILSIFSLREINTAVVQAIARGWEGGILRAFKRRIYGGFLGSFIALGISAYYFLNENLVLALSFVMIALFLPFMNALYVYRGVLTGKKLFQQLSLSEIATQLVALLAVGATVLLSDEVLVLLLVYFLTYIAMRGLLFGIVLWRVSLNAKEDTSSLTYGTQLSVIEGFASFASQVDKILIFHYLGAAPLAVYAFASAPVDQVRASVANVKTLALPKLSTRSVQEIKQTLLGKMQKLELVLVPLFVVYVLAAPFLFATFFPQYLDAVLFSQIIAVSILFIPRSLISVAFKAKKKTKELLIVRVVSPLLRISILWIATVSFGLIGVAVGLVLVEFLVFILYLVLFRSMAD